MRVGVRHQRIAVERRHPPVHRRIGRQPRFERANMRRHVEKTGLDRIESGERAQHRKVRRPNMRGNEYGARTAVERDLGQIPTRQPQDRPPVRMQVADALQPFRQRFGVLDRRQQNEIVYLARLTVLLVNTADLAGDDKARRKIGVEQVGRPQIGFEPIQPRSVGGELRAHFVAPSGVGEVARADQADPFSSRPHVEIDKVEFAAGRARVPRMNMQVGNRHVFPPYSENFLFQYTKIALTRQPC